MSCERVEGWSWIGSIDGVGERVAIVGLPTCNPPSGIPTPANPTPRGLFETMRAVATTDGPRLPLWQRHVARLRRSAAELGLPSLTDAALTRLEPAILDLLGAHGLADGIVRLTLSDAPQAGIRLDVRAREVTDRPLGLHVFGERRERDEIGARHKTTARSFYDAALSAARNVGADEAVIVASDGAVAETATGNLFVQLDGRWTTPDLTGPVLPGVARAALIEALRERGIEVFERRITVAELAAAEMIQVSNAVHGPRRARLITATGADPMAAPPSSPPTDPIPDPMPRSWAGILGSG